ncbi:asparagine--tRNA ligase [Candidatus Falkowbacteria bacterium CG_4_10_14_0_2_um_filter_41_15]|uniref:Asparagine--tRNA ligase n=2 Tax=Candidatus Falkowiibacteriota TaxID=1752728 RepID=A0A2G9ZMN0_9BACT|nr:MAG: asparagine--tRNA ligase [Candidatus Falkowbacteria bacterium CG23_combo_of_CG06-09_8_20_14_all_41_10]PJA09658.1 MAG: asparagine--tRNA ligase [Candidatus Falkowbacteria bacterium CG_4_10_14_0_2_um_filter_41_15]
MSIISIKEIHRHYTDHLNQEIKVVGWVRTVRSSKEFGFIELNDGSFFKGLQIVFDGQLKNFSEIEKTTIGSALEIVGILVESPAAGQPFELKASSVAVLGLAEADYPLQKKKHSFEFLRTIAHLRPRSNTFSAVFRLRSVLSFAIHKFFQEKGFIYVHSPIITTSDCEGAGEMFNVTTLDLNKVPKNEAGEVDYSSDFFGKKAGLTVSGQLNVEAMALAFKNVYTFGPTFRAENSNTTRHASEFWMLEPEIFFADLNDDMKLAEEMIKYVITYVLQELPEEMEFFNKFIDPTLLERLNALVNSEFKKMTYTEAVDVLLQSGQKFDYPVKWGIDLQTEHERYLTEQVVKGPVFLIDYPKDIKAFYMRLNDDQRTVAAMDLLVPGIGEIIGGSQREERLDLLTAHLKEFNLNPEDYAWYLDLRKYGGAKHAGFGLGFERALMYLSGMANIRDVIPFPRTPKNAEF